MGGAGWRDGYRGALEFFKQFQGTRIMAFKRAVTPTFKVLVTVMVANDKGGHDKNTFTAEFKRATAAEQEELRPMRNEDLVRRQLVGWDLRDADSNEPVPFGTDELEALLLITPTPMATAVAFWEGCTGARAKN